MATSLVQKLIEFYQEDPSDPFNLYALALEYQKSDKNQAKNCYNRLLIDFSDYLPTYYHAAQFFWDLDEIAIAEETFQKGIQLALKQENYKAHQELKGSFKTFQEEQLDW
jgi:lipoprotein NlpI